MCEMCAAIFKPGYHTHAYGLHVHSFSYTNLKESDGWLFWPTEALLALERVVFLGAER